jgi:hypothetical protein
MEWGAAGFWIFIAAVVVGGMWQDTRKKAERHETLRRIVEKTGTIDEAKLVELFKDDESADQKPGYAYRGLRIAGTIVMFAGAALFTFFLIFATVAASIGKLSAISDEPGVIAAFAVCAGIVILGYGLFFSSRFATPPVDSRNDSSAR